MRVVSCLLISSIACGCGGAKKVNDTWEDQRNAHGPTGVSGSFDLLGSALHATGEMSAGSLAAPFDWASQKAFPTDEYYLYISGAAVGSEQGFLCLQAPVSGNPGTLHVSAGSIDNLGVTRVSVESRITVHPKTGSESKPTVTFPSGWDNAKDALFFTKSLDGELNGLTIEGQTAAALIGTAVSNPSGPLTLTASTRAYQASGTVFVPSQATLTANVIAVGGDVASGSVDLEGRDAISLPIAAVGHGGGLTVTSGRLQSTAGLRVTQVLTSSGYALASEVELEQTALDARVPKDGTKWVEVRFREKGYLGDAVLKTVNVTGSGATMIQLPVEKPPTEVARMWEIAQSSGSLWATAVVAVPLAVTTPFVAMVDFFSAVVCAIGDCPESHPYPLWMPAGDIGKFFFKVSGTQPPGTYDAEVELVGHNYGPVKLTVRIVVE